MTLRSTRWMNVCGALALTIVSACCPSLMQSALAQATPAKAAVPTDRLLPPGVHLYVTAPDARELSKRWDGSLLGQMWHDKEMDAFRKEVEKAVAEKSDELKEKLGLTIEDLQKLPSGEASFALVQLPGKKPSMVGFLAYGDNEKTVDKLLDAAEQAMEKNGAKKKESEVDDTKVIVYTLPQKKGDDDAKEEDDADAPEPQQIAYFVRDSWLVVGSDLPVLEAVIARWDGKHEKTFADSEVHRYIVDRCKNDKSDSLLSWYANPVGLMQSVAQTSGNIQITLAMGLLPTLGLTNFKAVGGSYDLATSEFDSVSRTVMYVEQPSSGVLNVFQFPAIEQAPPKWIPAAASTWYGMNWDVAGAYESIEQVVDQLRGPGTFGKLVDRMAQQENGPKLHLKKDFVDLLSGKVEVFTLPVAKDGDSDEPKPDQFLAALGVKDKAKMEGVLAKIAKTPNFPGKTREFQGTTIYELAGAGGRADATMAMSVVNGQLMLTNDVTTLEGVLRIDKDQEALVDSAGYKKVAAKFPGKTSIAGFQKQDAQMKTFYELLRSGQGAAVTQEVDFTTLPPFESIRKYLPPTGSYTVPDKNGVLFVSFSLKGGTKSE